MDEDYWKDMLMVGVGTSIPVADLLAVGRPMKGSDVFFQIV